MLFKFRSILIPNDKLIISGQDERDHNKSEDHNQGFFGCSGKTTDNVIYVSMQLQSFALLTYNMLIVTCCIFCDIIFSFMVM